MTTVANPAANAQARLNRLRGIIPAVWAWVERGDLFTEEGARRLALASRWLRRCGLVEAPHPAEGPTRLDAADWRLRCDLAALAAWGELTPA